MSQKERQRHLVLSRVLNNELRVRDACLILSVSYRHAVRLVRAYRERGEASLVHGLRGRPGTRCSDPETKDKILQAYRSNYAGFGPTFASEKLAERDGLSVKPETLRLWLNASGDLVAKPRRGRHRQRRERRACFGELVQFDGSHHAWFEDRAPKCCLITLVDDATGRTHLHFTADEGTFAVMAGLRGWVETYGVPKQLYTDRLKTYLTDREPTVAEQLAGVEPQTQFGRACKMLGTDILPARSPQAKGRVENKHGLTQDRLVKELRLAGISDLAAANAFVSTWLPTINERFSVPAASLTDVHSPVPDNMVLNDIFCRHEARSVGNDWVVRYSNRYYQIVKQPNLPPSGSEVTVHEWGDGTIDIWFKGRSLQHNMLPARPVRPKPEKAVKVPKDRVPDAEHPWRQSGYGTKGINPSQQLIEGVADHYLGSAHLPTAVRDLMKNGALGTNI